jgi:hypothetical protein
MIFASFHTHFLALCPSLPCLDLRIFIFIQQALSSSTVPFCGQAFPASSESVLPSFVQKKKESPFVLHQSSPFPGHSAVRLVHLLCGKDDLDLWPTASFLMRKTFFMFVSLRAQSRHFCWPLAEGFVDLADNESSILSSESGSNQAGT